jgi:uncharacterized protein (TIGR02757 family)
MQNIKTMLDLEIQKRNTTIEISEDKPDPLLVAKKYNNEYISLICALFSYGNARLIVKFLNSLDFELLNKDENIIKKSLSKHYYRFQNTYDVIAIFITIKRLKDIDSIENIFMNGYKKQNNIIDGIYSIISTIKDIYDYDSRGYRFLIGQVPKKSPKSTYKRYIMYLRWMVRKDNIDMGLWSKINKKDLLIPLDTHTFNISKKLGLLHRKTYDFKAVIELTNTLKQFDINDPIKYDFAIYRLGQEKIEFKLK